MDLGFNILFLTMVGLVATFTGMVTIAYLLGHAVGRHKGMEEEKNKQNKNRV